MFERFYAGKRVLVTGHTGFKGGWLSLWLAKLGASVWGLARKPPTNPNLHEVIAAGTFEGQFDCDIRNGPALTEAVARVAPEVIFHLAAQPLVRRSYADPVETMETNVLGTVQVMEAVRRAELPCTLVVVTSDKCYENRGWEFGYRENDPLGGHDVYSTSKAAAELVVQAWRKSFFTPNPKLGPVASARGGNVIGGGDYAEDRIVPDAVRALLEERPIPLRNPAATRPWQHVLDCLSGYLWLGARLGRAGKDSALAGAFNFGPGVQAEVPVARLAAEILRHWPGECRDVSKPGAPHEARTLTLAIDKAAALLEWFPTWEFSEAIRQTVAWYRARHVDKNSDMRAFSLAQIETFSEAAARKQLAWTTPGSA
ncbi:MAG: CDP-glucose 4,6-dehydratase [Limisphaerales bacterium]